jgi:hypothetical protein
VIDTGRFQDFRSTHNSYSESALVNPLAWQMMNEQERLQALFQRQLQAVSCEASIGPERWLKWSVPEGTADPLGGLLHDDLVISAAMTAILDEQEWHLSLPPQIIQASDPLKEMDGGF